MKSFILFLFTIVAYNSYANIPEECMMQCRETRVLFLKLKDHKDLTTKFNTLCKDINQKNFSNFMNSLNDKYIVNQWSQSIRDLCTNVKKDQKYSTCVKSCKK